MSARVLVTGAGGFVGTHLVRLLRERGDDVVAIEHRWEGIDDLARRLGRGEIERCIHLAWHTAVDHRTSVSSNLSSLRAGLELLELLPRVGCRHVVGVGSGVEYAPQLRPHLEDDPLEATDPYAAAKGTMAKLVLEPALRPPGMRNAWARLFYATGPGEPRRRVMPLVACAALEGRPLEMTAGSQRYDLVHVDDVAAGLVAISDAGLTGPWNVSSGEPHSLRDVFTRLADRLGDAGVLRFGGLGTPEHDRQVFSGSSARLTGATGWRAERSLDEILDDVAAYWRGVVARRPDAATST